MEKQAAYRWDFIKKTVITVTMLFITLLAWGTVVNADTATKSSEEIESIADKYVKYSEVEKKFYVSPEISNELNTQEIDEVNSKINVANVSLQQAIVQNNPQNTTIFVKTSGETYIANPSYFRKFGVNKITFHWNYARIYLDRNQSRTLFHAGLVGGAAALGDLLGPVGGSAAGAAIGYYLTTVLSDYPKNGVWVDFNYHQRKVVAWGWQ